MVKKMTISKFHAAANRGEDLLRAWRRAGGEGRTAECIADILAHVYCEAAVAVAEAQAEGEVCGGRHETPDGVCDDAQTVLERLLEDERVASCRDE